MKYLLDTCVISDFVKGHDNVIKKIKSEQPDNLAVSTVTVMELHYGLRLNPQRAKKISPIITALLQIIKIIPYDNGCAEQTAIIRAQLKSLGTPIGSYDIMIAGTAIEHRMIMVTANSKEFKRVERLDIENWQ